MKIKNTLKVLSIIHLAFFNFCLAQSGEFDATFGEDGIVTIDFDGNHDIGRVVAIQPDSKIITDLQIGQVFKWNFL